MKKFLLGLLLIPMLGGIAHATDWSDLSHCYRVGADGKYPDYQCMNDAFND